MLAMKTTEIIYHNRFITYVLSCGCLVLPVCCIIISNFLVLPIIGFIPDSRRHEIQYESICFVSELTCFASSTYLNFSFFLFFYFLLLVTFYFLLVIFLMRML